ncbi:D-alanine--D-alanine ligase [Pelagibacteraceae bacterium]|nr:D-alanine--D-alanine ligase [Pelagibacteraceae bacterium]
MIIKDITKEEISSIGKILPLRKNNILPIKIIKAIEIVIVPNFGKANSHQDNVGIILEEKKILKILSKRYRNVVITEINCEKDLEKLVVRKPDLVFSGVKYFFFRNRKIWLNDYLEMFDIPYIASSKAALDNESNKNRAKKLMQKAKIKTADFFITNPGEYLDETLIPIKFPLFIKPVTGGDSRGIDKNSIVLNFESFVAKVLDIKVEQNSPSLVETYLSGKEYSVGIFEDSIDGSLRAMPIEIIVKKNVDGHCILDFDTKKK